MSQAPPASRARATKGSARGRLGWFQPTILDRYVAREIVSPSLLGLLLFTSILLLDQVANLMKLLVARGADLPTVIRIFGFLLPSIFSVTIPMAFLLGVLLAFGRLASESEIVALRASGVSPASLLRPVSGLAAVATAITFYVVAISLPDANQAYREVVWSLVVSNARTSIKPRVFTDDLPGLVIYVSDIPAETGKWHNVFVHDDRNRSKPRVILARGGRLVIDKERKAAELYLEQGASQTFDPVHPELFEEQRFAWTSLPLPFDQFFPRVPIVKGDREMTLTELWLKMWEGGKDARVYAVELHKKFAIPVACAVFGMLGLGLSLGSKKEARSAAFALSIGIIFIYYIFIRLGEQAGDTGMVSPFLAMWGANIVLGLIALGLLWLNLHETAFDPLDPAHYLALLPRVRTAQRPRPQPAPPLPGRRVVLVRVPRFTIPMPGLLDRYVARGFIGYFCLILVAFWSLFVLVDFINIFDDIQVNHIKGQLVLHYYTYLTPSIIHLLTPFSVLVSVLVTYGILSRRNEITAMKASGVSIYRVSVPVFALALLACGAMFGLSEYVLPDANRLAARDSDVIKGRPPKSMNPERRWVLGTDGRFYHYDFLGTGRRAGSLTLHGLQVFDVDAIAWEMRERLFAARALWNGESYDLERGWRRSFGPKGQFRQWAEVRTREIESAAYFVKEVPAAETLGFVDLRNHIASLAAQGFDVTQLRVQLHRKLAFPLVSLVMTVLAVPFSFIVARRGALTGVVTSIMIALSYWFFLAIFDALGRNAILPPLLAAWAPNLLFGAIGAYLVLTVET